MSSMIRFIPLDLPKFNEKQKVLDSFSGDTRFWAWQEEELVFREKEFDKEAKFKPSAIKKYPELISYIKKHWPFESFVYVKLFRAIDAVDPHVDGNYVDYTGPTDKWNTISEKYLQHQLDTEPCGYRMILKGNRKSIYMCEEYDYSRKDWTGLQKEYVEIPEETDCFLLRTNESPHGVDSDLFGDRLLLFAIGYLNKEKHGQLIDKSKEKYEDYMVL